METELGSGKQKVEWFVMYVYASGMKKAEKLLKSEGSLHYYIPKKYAVRKCGGKTKRELVPLISNLLFIRATHKQVHDFQKLYSVIGFVITLIDGKRTPLVVPDSQMENFIKVASHYEADLVYYRPDELNLSKGDYVRIIGGAFNGAKGQLVKIDGKRNKRFVVTIPNILSATVDLKPEFIQKITKEEFYSEQD